MEPETQMRPDLSDNGGPKMINEKDPCGGALSLTGVRCSSHTFLLQATTAWWASLSPGLHPDLDRCGASAALGA